jgi:hypothetical protein
MVSDRTPRPLPPPVGQTAPLLFLHDHDTIAVIAVGLPKFVGTGLLTVTDAGASVVFVSVFVTITVNVAFLPTATVGGAIMSMNTPGVGSWFCAYKSIEPKANSPTQRTFRL